MLVRWMAWAAIGLALATAGVDVAWAGLITYIDAPYTHGTSCPGGVVAASYGTENDVIAACGLGDTEQVICGGGVVGWVPGPDDQITVTCGISKP